MGISRMSLRDRFMGIEGANFPGNSRPNQGVSGTMMGFIPPFLNEALWHGVGILHSQKNNETTTTRHDFLSLRVPGI